ncbi:hypothetical protein MNBD_GAMMA06-1386 [hydrothermal vent metagenome]|uniref:Uncharacterized protein n=1 Tax=hydrothermal vent metagenome TaxID=652676 RepID=A0A3B0WGQ4_9ZZZZ
MKKQLTFHEKLVTVKLSAQAEEQSSKLNNILLIEIQIYFSCLLGKRLAFYTDTEFNGAWQVERDQFKTMLDDSEQLTDNIYIRFNTVMTKACPVSDYIGPPPVTDFTISNQKPYVPSWLNIDFKKDEWSGEYGWPNSKAGQKNTKQVRGQAQLAR